MPTTAADIPAVESEISGLTTPLHRAWRAAAAEGLEEAMIELKRREDDARRDRNAAIAIAALILLLLRRRVEAPLPAATRRQIRASSSRLLSSGMRSIGAGGRALSTDSETFTGHVGHATLELEFMSVARLEGTRMAARITRAVTKYFEALPDVVLPGSVSVPGTPPSRDTGIGDRPRKPSLVELRRDIEAILTDTNAALTETIVDAWAYRVHNVGAFLGARAAGVRVLVAQNPMDERTTPFCRWVNGKVISIERVERQMAGMQAAVAARDKARLIESWPFFNASKSAMAEARRSAGEDLPRGRRVSDVELFRRFFVKVGLPPFHWKCRTRAVPR